MAQLSSTHYSSYHSIASLWTPVSATWVSALMVVDMTRIASVNGDHDVRSPTYHAAFRSDIILEQLLGPR